LVVVLPGTKVHDSGAEEAPLNPGLDLQRGVGRDELFESGNIAAVIIRASQARGERPVDGIVIYKELQLFKHAGPVFRVVQAFDLLDIGMTRYFAGLVPDVSPLAQELLTQRRDIHHRIRTLLAGSSAAGSTGAHGRVLAAGRLMG